ncbi:MAG: carboxypeptidase regulatory-like domain-containing protein, partial [Anaerolineaceae bacterium]
HITGTVTDGSNPLQGIQVRVYHWTGSGSDWSRSTYTDASGHYDAAGLPTGTYRVRFQNYAYATEYFDDAVDLDSATDISVTAGSTTSNIDAVLVEWSHMTGTVTDGTNPISNISVSAYRHNGNYWEQVGWGSTDASGNYDIGHLPSGTYRVGFFDHYNHIFLSEYYEDAADLDSATDISVTAGSTTSGIDAVLEEGGHIAGSVTDGSNPLQGIVVEIYHWTGSSYDRLYSTGTDTSGNYDLSGLPTGTFRIRFYDDRGVYNTEYYDDAPDLDSATDISVTAGSTTSGIDAVLIERGHITGNVSDGTNPLQGIAIEAYLWTGSDYEWPRYAYTDASGNYDIGRLPAGTYRVRFYDHSGVYLAEFYDDAPDLDSATNISVTAGSTTSGIDAVLAKGGGHITGSVTDGTSPLHNIEVEVYHWTDIDYDWSNSTYTDTSGRFNIGGLPTGTYRLRFSDSNGVYRTEYYNDATDLDSASDVSVTGGSTTSGIDAILVKREGRITGNVTDGTNPLKDIQVKVYHWIGSDYDWSRSTYTDASGNYELNQLPPGTYRIRFRDKKHDIYITEYYDDAPELDDASNISVIDGVTTDSIDAILAMGVGRISGSVSDGANPLEDIQVKVYRWEDDDDDEWTRSTYTDASGNYEVDHLPPGTYRIRFRDNKHDIYITEFYDDAPDLKSATDVGVTAGLTTSGIDAVLAEWSHILGTVSDGTNPIANIEILAYGHIDGKWEEVSWDYSDASGNYDIGHLPAGTYRIRFRDYNNGVYITEYYDDAPDLKSATDISVTAGSTTSGIDAVLAEGAGRIAGTVTDGTNPLDGIEVMVCHWVGASCDDAVYGSTDATGKYDVGGLLAGVYRVRFKDDTGVYLTEWYDDAPNDNSATNVNVSAFKTTSGIDAVLIEGGHITGRVTDSTNPLQDIQVTVYNPLDLLSSTSTDASGNFDIGGLPTGSYRVKFSDDSGVYITEFYNDAPDLGSATDIRVTAGSTTSNIDAVLAAKTGRITGRVTNGTNPLQDIEVRAYHWTGSNSDWSKAGFTDASGQYDIGGLAAGIYRLRFYDTTGVFITEYYDDEPELDSASDIHVTAGSTNAGIDAVLVERSFIYFPSILAK